MSYANVAKRENVINYLKKDQAIVMNSITGIKIREYVINIRTKVGSKNVIFASRVSNDRICIYLSNKLLVDQLIQEYKTIEVENVIEIRRLVTSTKKLMLSNHVIHVYQMKKLKMP